MFNKIKGSLLIITTILILIANIYIIGGSLQSAKDKYQSFINFQQNISSLKFRITSLSGWESLYIQSNDRETIYLASRNVDKDITEIIKLKETFKNSPVIEKKSDLIILNLISELITKILNANSIEKNSESFELEIRSLTQLIHQNLENLENKVVESASDHNSKTFIKVITYLSVELAFFMVVSILLMISNSFRKRSEKRIVTIINSMPSMLITVNNDLNIMHWNSSAEDETGIPLIGAKGKKLFSLLPQLSSETGKIKECLKSKKSIILNDFIWFSIDDTKSFKNITIYPLLTGKTEGVVIILEDITKRRVLQNKIKESENRYKRLVENLGNEYFFYTYDSNGNTTYISPSVQKMLGFSPDDFINNLSSYLSDNPVNQKARIIKKSSLKGVKQEPYLMEIQDIESIPRWLELTEVPVFSENRIVMRVEGIAHDITEKKRVEIELNNYRSELERLVEERTRKLKETQSKLVQSEKMASLGGLVAGVAHDMNTPLGVIVTAASHMQDQVLALEKNFNRDKITKSGMKEYIKKSVLGSELILRNSINASDIINNFKKMAVNQSSEELREIDLYEHLKSIIISFNHKFKDKNIEIDVECPKMLQITSYPGVFTQIISNLLHNSFIHGFEKMEQGLIKIEIKSDNNNLMIIYRDSGKGLNSKDLNKIYEPFFTTKRGSGRSGLGMFIIYNLVTQTLNGEIKCYSNKGIEVYINIPLTA